MGSIVKYSNIEISDIESIEIKNLQEGDLEFDFIKDREIRVSLVIPKKETNNTILLVEGSVNNVSTYGNLFVFGNCNINKVVGSILSGAGTLKSNCGEKEDFVMRTSLNGATCRLEEIEDHKERVIKICGNLRSIKYILNKKNGTSLTNVCVTQDVKTGNVFGKVFGALRDNNVMSIKDYDTDYIYFKPTKLEVVYVEKEFKYLLYVKECEIEYKNKQVLKTVIEKMHSDMGKMQLIDIKDSNKVLWINNNFDSNIVHNLMYEYSLFNVMESYYLKTNLFSGFFYTNNIIFRLVIDKSSLMESKFTIKDYKLTKTDKEKLIDGFIFALRRDIYPRYTVGKAKGKELKYMQSTARGYVFNPKNIN